METNKKAEEEGIEKARARIRVLSEKFISDVPKTGNPELDRAISETAKLSYTSGALDQIRHTLTNI